jgi:ABC-2 type transport system permease protein
MMGYGVIKRYGFGLFCLYTAVVLGLAAWLLRRRDV